MRPVTLHVDDELYRAFKAAAKRSGRKTAELIREAMHMYRQQRIQEQTTLKDLQPASVGRLKRRSIIGDREDLLSELLDSGRK